MSDGRTKEGNFHLSGQDHVGHEVAAPVKMASVFLPADASADPLTAFDFVLAHFFHSGERAFFGRSRRSDEEVTALFLGQAIADPGCKPIGHHRIPVRPELC
jgi:hypothetical protein